MTGIPPRPAAGGFAQLGEALRWLRTRSHLTLEDVAAAAEISPSALSRYETGQTLPQLDTLERVLEGLGSDVLQLALALRILQGTEDPQLALPQGLSSREKSALAVVSLGFRAFIEATVDRRVGPPG